MKSLCFATVVLLATTTLTSAQSTDSKSILRRGNVLVAQQKYKLAIDEYNKVSTRDHDSYARAIYNIGVCYYELWQTDNAIEFYKRAVELKQGNYPKALFALGVALEDQGRTGEAKKSYEQAVSASHGEYARATFKLGLIEANASEFQKAATLFREAAARAGEHVAASHNNLGVMLANLGFLKEAEQEFIVALKASDGRYDEAAHNLNLCRSLTAGIKRDYKLSLM
jgi:tetratricopeptide (TPR) repeat protein